MLECVSQFQVKRMFGFIDGIASVNVDSLSRVFFLFLLVYDFADDDLSLEIVSLL